MIFNPYSFVKKNTEKKKPKIIFHKKNSNESLAYKFPTFKLMTKNNHIDSSLSRLNNYINYTFSDKNKKYILKESVIKKYKKLLLKQKKIESNPGLNIINNNSKSMNDKNNNLSWSNLKFSRESNINYKSWSKPLYEQRNDLYSNRMFFNNDITKKNNIFYNSNYNYSQSSKNQEHYFKTPARNESRDLFNFFSNKDKDLDRDRTKENEELNNAVNENIKRYYKIKVNSELNTNIPIKKKINILKEAKNSLDKMKKYKMNSSSSFRYFLDDSNQSKSTEKTRYFNDANSYFFRDCFDNQIANKRPIIIKYMPKPKLGVPKFKNV